MDTIDKRTDIHNDFIEWIKGIPYEIAFWNNVCRWTPTYEGMMNWSHYGKELHLDGFSVTDYLSSLNNPTVLDVGAGMSFAHGNYIATPSGNKIIEVHYIDPLARFYNNIKRKFNRKIPDIEFGMMEFLSSQCPIEKASMVIISNALDHSYNPIKGIVEALEVLQVGGYLYLNHHPDEAEKEKYKGFHKHNINLDDEGHLVIWNKSGSIIVDDFINNFATMESVRLENGNVASMICKTNEVSHELIDHKKDVQFLAELIDYITALFMKPIFLLEWTLSYWKYNTIQFFIQSLSWNTKQKIRKVLYK